MVTVAKVGLGCPLGRSDRPRELMGTSSLGTRWRRVGGGSRKDAPVCTSPSVTPEQPMSPDGRPSPSGNNAVPPAWTRPAVGGCQGHQQPGVTDGEAEHAVTEQEAGKEVRQVSK